MNIQDYVPKPPVPQPNVNVSDWTDPVLGMPVLAILAIVFALMVVLAYAIYASRVRANARNDRGGPPIEVTP